MKIYTKTGDDGATGLVGGARVSKADPVIQLVGSLDEANAFLGLACSSLTWEDLRDDVLLAQHHLFDLGAEIASPVGKNCMISDADVDELEVKIDRLSDEVPQLRNFILPGGTQAASYIHVARVVVRRLERELVEFQQDNPVRGEVRRYINRLSDWLFVLARTINARSTVEDVAWSKRAGQNGG